MLVWLLLQAAQNLRIRFLPCLFLSMLMVSATYAGGGPRNVVVVRNLDSPESREIANYYICARHIPPENVCDISTSTAEFVSQCVCETEIVAPIRAFLQKLETTKRIDYIVLTKGVPLGADYYYPSGPLSVTSVLTCVGDPRIHQYLRNPYGPAALLPNETAFTHDLCFDDPLLEIYGFHLYLVTRLDGYTVSDVLKTIDGSLTARNNGPFLIDRIVLADSYRGGYRPLNNRLETANSILVGKGIPTIYDNTTAFLGGYSGLTGYFGWGSNDGQFTIGAYRSNTFAPGSIADTHVSTSARTFYPWSSGQSLIGDLIASGACGTSGYVSEPGTTCSTYGDVLFDEYTKGYNMAESFYMACPELYWKSTVVGDPLMAAFAVRPQVSVMASSGPLTGEAAALAVTATHPKGVSRVDFYFDNEFIGTSKQAPFSVSIDTTKHVVGPHTMEAIAYENSPVATQGSVIASVEISNQYSMLRSISDAYHSPDGQGVKLTGKVVIAGTSDMGGSEFYVEEPGRAGGMRVASTAPTKEGDIVAITGALSTESGERTVVASEVLVTGKSRTALRPLFMRSSFIGGGDWSSNTRGVTGGLGLRTLGLLVCVAGRVTYVGKPDEQFFYIDDGCRLSDSSGHTGLRIQCGSMCKPLMGSYLSVVGVSSCHQNGKIVDRLVKVRQSTDIQTLAL